MQLYGVEWDDTQVRRPRIITCHPPSRNAAAYGKAMGRAGLLDTMEMLKRTCVSLCGSQVIFSVNGAVVRTKLLDRPLAPLKLQLSLWTTIGGWPGLIQ
jgi:hypothetical protein